MNEGGQFPRTRWSLVRRAVRGDEAEARAAREEICADYWYPLYAFARRSGRSAEDAEDLTQDLFQRLITRNLLARADPERGRLRSFLLGTMQRCLSEASRSEHRQKRGSGIAAVSLDAIEAEKWLETEQAQIATPEIFFDRAWARLLLRRALSAVEHEYQKRGAGDVFDALKGFLDWNRSEADIPAAAAALGQSRGTVNVALHRLRLRFHRALEREVAKTLSDPADAEDELRHLLRALIP
jgi:RNA polymerase sigma factor (sigma-70 family)